MSDDGIITLSDEFKYLEEDRIELGQRYNQWKATYGDQITINYIDPKNTANIAAYLFKHCKIGYISFPKALKYLLTKIKLNAVFVNGYYLENIDNFDKMVQQVQNESGVQHGKS